MAGAWGRAGHNLEFKEESAQGAGRHCLGCKSASICKARMGDGLLGGKSRMKGGSDWAQGGERRSASLVVSLILVLLTYPVGVDQGADPCRRPQAQRNGRGEALCSCRQGEFPSRYSEFR